MVLLSAFHSIIYVSFRVILYNGSEEHLLALKQYVTRSNMKNELLADMREAYKLRDIIFRKISIRKAIKSNQVRNTSHIMIQVGDITFYDLADIETLN